MVATYAMARGWVDFWLCWIAVDLVGVPLLLHSHFYPSAVLYGVYGGLRDLGLRDLAAGGPRRGRADRRRRAATGRGAGMSEPVRLDTVERAIADIAAGKAVVVVDDEDRENEGDLVVAASKVTPELLAFMVRHTSGVVCVPMEGAELDRLKLPPMTYVNEDRKHTAYSVSVDARDGISTGISAADRARTIRVLVDSATEPYELTRPGHIFPLRAVEGGVLRRAGHTEASVDLARLAGLNPAGVIAEIVSEDGSMARLPELRRFADEHGLALVSIADLVTYRKRTETLVERMAEARLPTRYGEFLAVGYRSTVASDEHVALVRGDLGTGTGVLVRLHSECLTGDVLGSLRCDCGPQLDAALRTVADEGRGVVVYLRGHEGRGIGLMHKLAAYRLQDGGRDTVDANLDLGLPADARDFSVGAQILADLGVSSVRLITNNPAKRAGIEDQGLTVVEQVPLEVHMTPENIGYLRTKRDRMGHDLPGLGSPSRTIAGPRRPRRSGRDLGMSGVGSPDLEVDGSGLRVAIVAAQWHTTVMDGLVAGAQRGLAECGVTEPLLVRVPGSFELPVAAARLARSGYDAVVALGVVIRGGTPHFDYVCHAATDGLSRVAVDTGVPVGFGLLTCDDEQQALDRAGLDGLARGQGAGGGARGRRHRGDAAGSCVGHRGIARTTACASRLSAWFLRAAPWSRWASTTSPAPRRSTGPWAGTPASTWTTSPSCVPPARSSRCTRSPTCPATPGDEVPAGRDRRIHLAINVGSPRRSTPPWPSSSPRAALCCARRKRRSGAATPRSWRTPTGMPGRSRTTPAGRSAWTVCRSFPDLCEHGRVKTFDELFAELSRKASDRPEKSGTVAALDAGVHSIGKKVVEEAAEVWMAAEHESPERTAEEISQLLYHLQVLMIARGLSLDDVYARL